MEFEILRKGEIKYNQTHILDFKRAYFSKLREILGVIPWSDELKNKRVNEGWELLKNEILKAQYQTVPMKRRNGRNQKKSRWMTKEFLNELKFKRDMYMKWKKEEITKEQFKI